MFVEKIILEELHEDGRVMTTVVQSSRGKPILLDYAAELDIPGAHYGPYTIIRRNKNALQELISQLNLFNRLYNEEYFEGRLSDHRFRSLGDDKFTIQQEWYNIPVESRGGCGIVYALRLPQYANIDDLSLEGDVQEQRIIRDYRFNVYFITFVLKQKRYNDRNENQVSFHLICHFTINKERFINHAYEGKYSDKSTNEFQPTDNPEMNPAIQSVLFSDNEYCDERTVFLSHKSSDKPIVRGFAEALKENGIKPWFDEWQIMPGDSIPREVSDGLSGSDVLAVFLSPDSVASLWVDFEASFAFYKSMDRKFSIIPVLLKPCGIPPLFEHIKYIDYSAMGFDNSVRELINAVRHQRKKLLRIGKQ